VAADDRNGRVAGWPATEIKGIGRVRSVAAAKRFVEFTGKMLQGPTRNGYGNAFEQLK